MTRDFQQIQWDAALETVWQELLTLAVREDLGREHDWTTVALISSEATCKAAVVARKPGVIAGLPAAAATLREFSPQLTCTPLAKDGDRVTAGQPVATIAGPARAMLTAERPVLNVVGHLSGIATLTRQYVDAVAGTRARVYDTRKTTPGWRRLEKYAVRCGGGHNHRLGLNDAVLIKDNHLAIGAAASGEQKFSPSQAVGRVRDFLRTTLPPDKADLIIEIEVDSLDQLRDALTASPDIVLVDNMPTAMLREAVAIRDATGPAVELEASGGVTLQTIGDIARTGVDRISVGALTHSAPGFDVGLDWES